ncbi:MAG: hypothetical protein RL674_1167 [Pseudomonadota bacterium]|jgi:hypothetical protein
MMLYSKRKYAILGSGTTKKAGLLTFYLFSIIKRVNSREDLFKDDEYEGQTESKFIYPFMIFETRMSMCLIDIVNNLRI